MTTSLSTRQGLLTKSASKLSALLEEGKKELSDQLPHEGLTTTHLQEKKLRLLKLQKGIQTATTHVDVALQNYTRAADALDNDTPQLTAIIEKVLANSSTMQDLLVKAQSLLSELEMAPEDISTSLSTHTALEITPIQLTPIPIPKFSGEIWEWESFWSAFEFSLHTRNMGDIHKRTT
ncbi:unnamed protein product [Nippostrongylus brasiliensis]|uniref:Dynactin subunit 2 n=1 Tax=Nippostrongylus brasiliensis TaxID=27835 RepID=A0A0N4YDB9_NIPBR|nr:unnamed protein product [Nippostrongylus brasiliensis]